MLQITSLPAREGDALWIKWGDEANPFQMIIDMGTEAIGKKIRSSLEQLPEDQRKLELLVISHIDRDHIGGVLTCLAEADPLPGLEIEDVWFNGFTHLSGGSVAPAPGNLESMGAAQGERLSQWLRTQNWNKAFAGSAVVRDGQPSTISLADDLKVTILGPTPERLAELEPTWVEEVHKAIERGSLDNDEVSPGLEAFGTDDPPELEFDDSLELLAISHNKRDPSEANGSSIALLLEYQGRKLLLSGDAFAEDIAEAIAEISPDENLALDVFKLPHHGSRNNVHKEIIENVDCERWLISTDGNRFKHPDAEAIARIITHSNQPEPLISFNVPCKFNQWWDNPEWISRYGYRVEYGDIDEGLTLSWA